MSPRKGIEARLHNTPEALADIHQCCAVWDHDNAADHRAEGESFSSVEGGRNAGWKRALINLRTWKPALA